MIGPLRRDALPLCVADSRRSPVFDKVVSESLPCQSARGRSASGKGRIVSTREYGRNVTILDVAEEAGVSFKTVSRVINGEAQVRATTRDKVMEAVRTLGYRPNHNARNLRAKRSRRIALLVANPSRNYLSELQWGAVQRCQDEGAVLSVEQFEGVDALSLLGAGAEAVLGVILPPPLGGNRALLDALAARNIPAVQIAAAKRSRRFDCVHIDDRAAAREMTEHLLGLGHTRIGYIGSPEIYAQTAERLDGYRDALESAGIAFDDALVRDGAFTFESGRDAARDLLDLSAPPTAIFASNDDMAAGVIAESYRRGLHVPDELAIAGFDDTPLATVMTPALTTVYQPVREMADAAVGLLLARQNDPDAEVQSLELPHKIKIRDTTTGRH